MKTTHIEVRYVETRSANFQSATCGVTLRAELEGETEADAATELESRCRDLVDAAFARYEDRKVAMLLAKAEAKNGGTSVSNRA